MKVSRVDDLFKVFRITGPKHNYLGLAVSVNAPETVLVVKRRKEGEVDSIDELQLVQAVDDGLRDGSDKTGPRLFAQRIEYVPSDTPEYSVYRMLAFAIAECAHKEMSE